jgi:hypothetical protein
MSFRSVITKPFNLGDYGMRHPHLRRLHKAGMGLAVGGAALAKYSNLPYVYELLDLLPVAMLAILPVATLTNMLVFLKDLARGVNKKQPAAPAAPPAAPAAPPAAPAAPAPKAVTVLPDLGAAPAVTPPALAPTSGTSAPAVLAAPPAAPAAPPAAPAASPAATPPPLAPKFPSPSAIIKASPAPKAAAQKSPLRQVMDQLSVAIKGQDWEKSINLVKQGLSLMPENWQEHFSKGLAESERDLDPSKIPMDDRKTIVYKFISTAANLVGEQKRLIAEGEGMTVEEDLLEINSGDLEELESQTTELLSTLGLADLLVAGLPAEIDSVLKALPEQADTLKGMWESNDADQLADLFFEIQQAEIDSAVQEVALIIIQQKLDQ